MTVEAKLTEQKLNMWGRTLEVPPPTEFEQYQKEIDQRYPENKGYYIVVGINPKDSSQSGLCDDYGEYTPQGWLIGTHSSRTGKTIVTVHNPLRTFVAKNTAPLQIPKTEATQPYKRLENLRNKAV